MIKSFKDKVTVITGAGSGIGRALAIELARQGSHLAISAINEKNVLDTAELIDNKSVRVTTHVLDVANREAVYAHADEVVLKHGKANIIINNAGVALGETIEDMSYDNFEAWCMAPRPSCRTSSAQARDIASTYPVCSASSGFPPRRPTTVPSLP